jgi:hypothetical protein
VESEAGCSAELRRRGVAANGGAARRGHAVSGDGKAQRGARESHEEEAEMKRLE